MATTTASKFWIIEKDFSSVKIGYLIDGTKASTTVEWAMNHWRKGWKCQGCGWNCEHVRWVKAQNVELPPAPEVVLSESDFEVF